MTVSISAMADRIELWPVDRLQPYARNARTHSEAQVEQIAASIREFGFTNPILVDSADGIIAGHGRLMAAKRLELGQVPVIVLDHLSEEQRRAYILADNKLALNAGWDEALLAEELEALRADGFDLALTGFSDDELAELLPDGEDEGTGVDPDAIPEPEQKPVSRPGDIWILGDHRLMCGSSTSLADVERLCGGETIDCVWTDPPYGVAYESKNSALAGTALATIANDTKQGEELRAFLHDAFVSAFAVLRPGGPIYVAHADTEGLSFRAAFQSAGFKLSGCLIWRKPALVLGRSDYQWQHEPILYGWKPGAAHSWFGGRKETTLREVDEYPPFLRTGEREWQISVGGAQLVIRGSDISVEEIASSVILEEKPKESSLHPTMKPVRLVERMLVNSTQRGSAVLDLFGGSGTTLIACHLLGRRARLMELEPRFVDVIVRRWQEFTGKMATLEGTSHSFADVTAGSRTAERARPRRARRAG